MPLRRTLLRAAIAILGAASFHTTVHAEQILGISFFGRTFAIDATTGASTALADNALAGANSMTLAPSGIYYTTNANQLLAVDPTTGTTAPAATIDFGGAGVAITGLAAAASGTLFAINRAIGGAGEQLWRLDPLTGAGSLVGATGLNGIQGLSFAPNGMLYGWDTTLGLVTLSLATGAAADVDAAAGGAVGAGTIQTLAFAPSGTLYGAESSLYTIDVASGIATFAVPIQSGFDLRGMEFVPRAATGVPEPSSSALAALALGLIVLASRPRR
jgi:hypothetical protein